MHAAFIMLSFLLSCGPEECKDLVFSVDLVLDEEEELYQETYRSYRSCESECNDAFVACMELAGVIVEDDNKAPDAKTTGDQLLELQQTCWLDGSPSSDPDGDPLLPSWVLLNRPDGSQLKPSDIDDKNQLVASFVPDVQGVYKAKLTVDDGKLTDSTTIEIEVVNQAPASVSVSSDPSPGVVGGPVVVSATVVDPDNDPESAVPDFDQTFTYAWTFASVPEGSELKVLKKPTQQKADFLPDVAGVYEVALTVSDGELEASGTFEIDVVSGFAPPEDDTGFVPPTEEECEAAYDACEKPCVHPDELDYPYTKRDSPIISWTGENLMAVSVVISQGPNKDDVVWGIKCPKDDNCISSPVVYGVVPPGAELNTEACKDEKCDTEQRSLLVDGQKYKASGARDIGEKFPCVPREEDEYEFEHPNRSVYSFD